MWVELVSLLAGVEYCVISLGCLQECANTYGNALAVWLHVCSPVSVLCTDVYIYVFTYTLLTHTGWTPPAQSSSTSRSEGMPTPPNKDPQQAKPHNPFGPK